jgi:hypothetical protein
VPYHSGYKDYRKSWNGADVNSSMLVIAALLTAAIKPHIFGCIVLLCVLCIRASGRTWRNASRKVRAAPL